MPERHGYTPGVPCWVDTTQPDPMAAVAFYRDLFGWEFEDGSPPGSEGEYLVARIRGGDVAAVGSAPEAAPPVAVWNTYICVGDADETTSKVRNGGGGVAVEPFDVADAGRMAVVSDPEGAVFRLWQARGRKGAGIVNEHGSVNFNDLNVRDPDRARSFYGSVFGWQTLESEGGFSLWTLPGYGEFLERDTPDLREQMAEIGAPKGFEDVVALLVPIPDDERGIPPHWGVVFAVDDADAIAEKAIDLGGKVVVPPVDETWVRTTIIADPQGATFRASAPIPQSGVG